MQSSLFCGKLRREIARVEHGGTVRSGRRKLERPVSTRRPMHLTLYSLRARGRWSLRKHERSVQHALRISARRSGIRVYEFANVGSHLHLLVRTRHRHEFQAFLRSFAGMVAQAVTGARNGSPSGRFWSLLAWSRIVSWGRDQLGVRQYILRNRIEAESGPGVRHALEHGPSAREEMIEQRGPPRTCPMKEVALRTGMDSRTGRISL
jgi:hypothetical protein